MKKLSLSLFVILLFAGFNYVEKSNSLANPGIELTVLGVSQDAGAPHIGCVKKCCTSFRKNGIHHPVVALGIEDFANKQHWLFEATPDLPQQLGSLLNYQSNSTKKVPDGIFLTHAHIGHYTGLMYLGREALSANKLPVYCMPKMKAYLQDNGPWSQLIRLDNIELKDLLPDKAVQLNERLIVTPFIVPHRDEFSETVGYMIEANGTSILFIPDINKWHIWDRSLIEIIKEVDYAFLDATFYDITELPGRDHSEIPHPFVVETMELLAPLSINDRKKVYFIHFNHSNPLLDDNSAAYQTVLSNGFMVAKTGMKFNF